MLTSLTSYLRWILTALIQSHAHATTLRFLCYRRSLFSCLSLKYTQWMCVHPLCFTSTSHPPLTHWTHAQTRTHSAAVLLPQRNTQHEKHTHTRTSTRVDKSPVFSSVCSKCLTHTPTRTDISACPFNTLETLSQTLLLIPQLSTWHFSHISSSTCSSSTPLKCFRWSGVSCGFRQMPSFKTPVRNSHFSDKSPGYCFSMTTRCCLRLTNHCFFLKGVKFKSINYHILLTLMRYTI